MVLQGGYTLWMAAAGVRVQILRMCASVHEEFTITVVAYEPARQ